MTTSDRSHTRRPSGNRPSTSARRRLGSLVVALAAALLLAACTGVNQPKEYGDAYEKNFMIGCTGVEPNEQGEFVDPDLGTLSYCECVYRGLVDTVPFEQVDEFEKQQSEQQAGQIVVPANIQAVYDRCKGGTGGA